MRRILRERDVEAAVKGGAVFAAGGGGWADHGRMLGTAAVNAGEPELVTVDEIADEAWIATAAAIGAPASTTQWQMLGVDYVKAVELAQRELGAPIYGLMIGQNGKSSTLNGWLPGAVLGTKVSAEPSTNGSTPASPASPAPNHPAGSQPPPQNTGIPLVDSVVHLLRGLLGGG